MDENTSTKRHGVVSPDAQAALGGLEFVQGLVSGALPLNNMARTLGYDEIGLHVFGDNEIARNLYRSAGYVETNVSMVKRLG